jgi:CheY-like chemotaxis protein
MNACDNPILLVDDDPDIRESLKGLLEDEGYSVKEAANGKEALDVLNATPIPCLILLDLTMPIMDGWRFLEELRHTSAAGVPVVVLTAADPRKPILGVRKIFMKPIPLGPLLNMVADYCAT